MLVYQMVSGNPGFIDAVWMFSHGGVPMAKVQNGDILILKYTPKLNSIGVYWSRVDITGNTMKHLLCFDRFVMA